MWRPSGFQGSCGREFSPSERVGATYAVEIESVVKEPDSEVAARGGSRGMLNEV